MHIKEIFLLFLKSPDMRKNHQIWHSVYIHVPPKKVINSYNPDHFCLAKDQKPYQSILSMNLTHARTADH